MKVNMKKFSFIFLTFYMIFGVSDVCGIKFPCKRYSEKCNENSNCCSQNCQQYGWFKMLNKCGESINLFDRTPVDEKSLITENMVETKHNKNKLDLPQDGWCSFYRKANRSEGVELYSKFGVSAAHFNLPPNTKLALYQTEFGYTHYITVTVNDEVPSKLGTILDISEEAAAQLGIENEGVFSCLIEHPSYSIRYDICGIVLLWLGFCFNLIQFY